VIVTGCSRGLVPFFNADETPEEQAATLCEQRRLFYVAITRCTESLVISSVSNMERKLAHKLGARLVFGQGATGRTVASQFLDELGPEAPAAVRGQDWAASGFGL
jgi:superfamily I DNA/RNA helicase